MSERIYIGSYAKCIQIGEFEEGNLKIIGQIENIIHPSYLNINRDILYAVSETNSGNILSFKLPNHILMNQKDIRQSLPCYISTDEHRKHLLVANYKSGSIIMYALKQDGSIGKREYKRNYRNANMHFAQFIEEDILAIDLGNDTIYIYNTEMQIKTKINLDEKSGPRHLVVSKDKQMIYVVTELSNQIYVYKKQGEKFVCIQKVHTLMDSNTKSYAGAIKMSKDNQYLYVTNRGHNSVSVFYIKHDGMLVFIQNISSYGDFPRDIYLNKNDAYVMVANQNENNIVIYERNFENGTLRKLPNSTVKVDKPSCIVRSNYEV